MAKVLISDKMSPLAEAAFKARGVEVDVKPGLTPDELCAIIGAYDGLAVRSSTKVTQSLLEHAANLKVIGRAGVGIDNINLAAATALGAVVMNTPYGNAITTAEHAISMLLALARHIPAADASTRAGKWEKTRFMGVELMGKTLGVIGCGNIGALVAERGQGLKMKVIAYDPYLSQERAEDLGVERMDLDDLLARADFISLHTPLTDETRNIINAEAIAKTRPGVRIINCARGGLVDEEALLAALESGHVAGAALDVFAEEPARGNPLFAFENVVVTPHLGASTLEAQEKVAEQMAEQMADFLLTGAVLNALNMASVSAEEAPRLRPYMQLAEHLGSFAGQATQSGILAVTIEYEGHAAELNCKPLTAVVLQGLLAPQLAQVNMVNAPAIAKQRNIDVTEVRHEKPGDYLTMIKLTVTTEQQTRSVAGTLFAGKRPRLVEIKGIPIEAELGPNMLFITNHDEPGMIGALGSLLGGHGINIATFHLGRAEPGGDAIALIEVDSNPGPGVMAEIEALPQIQRAVAMHF